MASWQRQRTVVGSSCGCGRLRTIAVVVAGGGGGGGELQTAVDDGGGRRRTVIGGGWLWVVIGVC